jgi:hypothetical protein
MALNTVDASLTDASMVCEIVGPDDTGTNMPGWRASAHIG